MRKQFILLFAIMATVIPASAYDFSATMFGNTLYFEMITDSTCRIVCPTGNWNGPWLGYTQPSGMLQIVDEVITSNGAYQITEIGPYAFAGTNITSLYIASNHLTNISLNAFYSCNLLTTVDLSYASSLDLFGSSMFGYCNNLINVGSAK